MRSLDPIYFAPQPKLGGGWICYKDSPSPPPPPDYKGAATATSQSSTQAAITNYLLNLGNQSTPLGTRKYTQNGTFSVPGIGDQAGFDIPRYDSSIEMTPEGKGIYDQQMGISKGLLGLGQGSLDQTRASLGQPQDLSSVQDIADKSYANYTARLDPQWDQRKKQFDAQMANQGIVAGGEAYDNASRDFGQQRNDAYTQANQAAINTMPQTYQLSTAERMQPLTELNAIRTGAQPQMPQFQATPTAGGAQGANMLGAQGLQNQYDMGLYNSQVGQSNSMTNGLMGLAGTIGAAFISDRRMKRDIEKVGDDPRGFGIYKFRYLWDDVERTGVMADEVEKIIPEAVIDVGGVKAVNYGML